MPKMPGNGLVAMGREMTPIDVCGIERGQYAHLNRQATGARDGMHGLQ